jgi:predicted site-specific integrase-resolvase
VPKKDVDELADLITQVRAAEMRGVSRAAINYLVKSGRLRVREMFGRKLVYRSEVESFMPQKRGPKVSTKKGRAKR